LQWVDNDLNVFFALVALFYFQMPLPDINFAFLFRYNLFTNHIDYRSSMLFFFFPLSLSDFFG